MICGSYMTSYTGKITQLQTTADIVSSFSSVLTWRKSWRESGRSLWKKFTLCIRRLIHFHWSSRHSCLGNCLVWKINMCEKTSTLRGWTQMVVKLSDLSTGHSEVRLKTAERRAINQYTPLKRYLKWTSTTSALVKIEIVSVYWGKHTFLFYKKTISLVQRFQPSRFGRKPPVFA